MNDKFVMFRDFIQLKPNEELVKLGKTDRHKFMDSVLNIEDSEVPNTPKGLLVDFDLSHSARRINNRIYPPNGQKAGLSSWTQPYKKPILINHDRERDPIGRFKSVEFVPLEDQAIRFFKHINDYMDFVSVFDKGDPQQMYKALKKHKLLTNKSWPGLAKLAATARITDSVAIEKFLDERYLTFSAGTYTDKFVCGACGSPWHEGEICEHRPGKLDDNGDIGIYFTGTFIGDEGSVVPVPGDDLGQVSSLMFEDSFVDSWRDEFKVEDFLTDTSTIYVVDSSLTTEGDNMNKNKISPESLEARAELVSMDARDIAKHLLEDTFEDKYKDALQGLSHFEVMWLIRVHDALHMEYDWKVKHSQDEAPIPPDVFKLHGDLHQLSVEKDFRGSILNGPLDNFDSAGKESDEYVLKTKMSDAKLEEEIEDSSDDTESISEVEEKEDRQEDKEQEELLEEPEADWFLLDLALESLVAEDAKLSAEAREKLPDSAFCGPERSFPVNDCAHYTAALKLLGRYKGPGNKDNIRSCIESRGKKLGCNEDSACGCRNLKDQLTKLQKSYDDLLQDHTQILKQIDELQSKVVSFDDTSNKNEKKVEEELASESSNSDTLNVVSENKDSKEEFVPTSVEAPEIVNLQEVLTQKDDKFGEYEQSIKDKYLSILDTRGQIHAMAYLRRKFDRGYISRDFVDCLLKENKK